MLCAWANAGNIRQRNAAAYLALDIMMHLLVRKVEHPTLLSHRKVAPADKKQHCRACIKRYCGPHHPTACVSSFVDTLTSRPRVVAESPICVHSRCEWKRIISG